MIRRTMAVIVWLALWTPAARAQPAEPWLGDLDFPTNMAFAPDGRLFFTEKETGLVRVVDADGTLRPEPFASFAVEGAGEAGLLGIALHPAFDDGEPWVYLYLSDLETQMNRVVRLRAEGDAAAGEPELLLDTVQATRAYHNGGDLLFGADGMLYVSVGEGHESELAQDLSDLGGKVLRLTPEGDPAPGNPFGETAPYTLGHRNSFGLCLDPATERIWETENGPDRDDEVNRLEPGGNYGWPAFTGRDGDGQFVDPVAVFEQPIALTGCAWRDGQLYVGSFNDGAVHIVDPTDGDVQAIGRFDAGVTDLQVGPDGALYVATSDAIWRLGSSAEPSGGPSPGGPVDAPPLPPEPGEGQAWIALVAAAVLAVGLGLRLVAGRRLRARSSDA